MSIAQQLLDHVRDLGLLRATHAHHGELDGARRVLVHAERLRHGGQRRAARLAELERAVGILGEEHAFDGDFLGRVLRDQLRHARMNDAQPVGQRSAGGGDAALRDDAQRCRDSQSMTPKPVRREPGSRPRMRAEPAGDIRATIVGAAAPVAGPSTDGMRARMIASGIAPLLP